MEYGITDEEYKIVDQPYLAYQVHFNKQSIGCRLLFQRDKTIKTFKELEKACLKNKNVVGIYDEYGKKYIGEQYYDRVYSQNRYSGFMNSIHFSKTEVRHYILYRVVNRRRKYICRLTIGCML